ncbi:MAG TPA: C45 family autoproteolytic acyltransferase/hydrolase [Candidatus Brocadiia bacterium]|nr:C45 family autoproteolytic acyltransferase/hydrolase [Candidatus Brocadiia bacterium]
MRKTLRFAFSLLVVILLSVSQAFAGRDAGIVETDLTPNPPPGAAKHKVIRTCGPAKLIQVGRQRVLYLQGTHREMGLQHGKILAAEMENPSLLAESFIYYAGKKGKSESELMRRAKIEKPFIPEYIREEMEGLAKGAGVPLERLEMVHAIPSFFHCTGLAAFGEASADGELYQTRSLDYAIDITLDKKNYAQDQAVLIVCKPTDKGYAHCYLGWLGFIGCLTGMNEKRISVSEMGSGCRDEAENGMPMIFMLRKVMEEASTLKEAEDVFVKGPRTCGFNFIVGDGKIPDAAAIETTRSLCKIMPAGDKCNAVPPHTILPKMVWRVNHFVDPETAATQRSIYDPSKRINPSFIGHSMIAGFAEKNYGKIDGPMMVTLLRMYLKIHPCLHQAAMCPGKGDIWVSHANNPSREKYPGAQNQAFYRFNLFTMLGETVAGK